MTRLVPLRGLGPHAVVNLAAVLLSGFAAAHFVSGSLGVATGLVAFLVWRGAREPVDADGHILDLGSLPSGVRSRVHDALEHCGGSDARRMLIAVTSQARSVLTRASTQLDESAERETRANISSLVEACCSTAESLADLDGASGTLSQNADAAARASAMRQRLADQLAGAAKTLGDLYLAGLEQETEALSRVSQLTAEIHEDAVSRQTAAEEIRRVLQ